MVYQVPHPVFFVPNVKYPIPLYCYYPLSIYIHSVAWGLITAGMVCVTILPPSDVASNVLSWLLEERLGRRAQYCCGYGSEALCECVDSEWIKTWSLKCVHWHEKDLETIGYRFIELCFYNDGLIKINYSRFFCVWERAVISFKMRLKKVQYFLFI